MTRIDELKKTISALRHPQTGCPWDLQQTHKSLLPFLIEEAFEFRDSVSKGDWMEMEEEIGDVLLQVLLHCQLAQEANQFDFESVAGKLNAKMIRRHPHVFSAPSTPSISSLHQNWKEIKEEEKKLKGKKESFFSSKDSCAPALQSSYQIGKKSQEIGFDWANAKQVMEKVEEEWDEFKTAISESNEKVVEELGDFLFTIAQLSRHLGSNPEEVLEKANKKFIRRFTQMEEKCLQEKINFKTVSREKFESLWQEVKNEEKS